jgi:DNA-binding NtrC family response regulator
MGENYRAIIVPPETLPGRALGIRLGDMPKKAPPSSSSMRVLAVDDDPSMLELARIAAEEDGAAALRAVGSAAAAFIALAEERFDLVFLDLGLGDRSGSTLLSDVISAGKGALIVVVTADERPATVVECIKRGAFDYVAKPISAARLLTIMSHVRSVTALRLRIDTLSDNAGSSSPDPAFARIITRSPLMFGLFKTIERVARSPLAVLVAGESGVGKELVSRSIHDLSGRDGAFVPVNVAGLDDNLFADSLFGHVKGAYTGAEGKRLGLVRGADDGTLFLDEIGDIGPEAQVKLLRFLQDGEFYPLGSDKPEKSSARLVLATNADLQGKVRMGSFRSDLYYRLTIHYLSVPPLRARREDIPLLVEIFSAEAAAALGRPVPRRLDGFIAAVKDWPFPGNVRELFALVHGAMSMSDEKSLSVPYAIEYMSSHRLDAMSREALPGQAECLESVDDAAFPTLGEIMDRHIREALKRSEGNQTLAAQLLGISQSTISRKLRESPMKNA